MAREFLRVFTHEELVDACRNAEAENTKADRLGLAVLCEPYSQELVGKEFRCSFDDATKLVFRFPELNTVEWSENGSKFYTEFCEPQKSSAGNVIGVHFYRRHVLPFEGAFVVFDLDTGFVTWVSIKIGTSINDKNGHAFPHFGEIEGVGSREGERHHFSCDYVGTVIDWKYNDKFTIRHSYVTPDITISMGMPEDEEDENFIERRFLPACHVKVRDKLLLTTFSEPGGCTAVLLIDLKIVHDIGCFYGIGGDGKLSSVPLSAVGGFGRAGLKPGMGYAKPFLDI